MGAITMHNGRPQFDRSICIRCAGCEEFCPASAIRVSDMGYKVVVGGMGARHPAVARTVAEHTDLDGVLRILERAVRLIRDNVTAPVRVFSMRRLIARYGIEPLRD
jgi:dissimilatory sulfite reductase (desulfoviridin) alpha/beta subunit